MQQGSNRGLKHLLHCWNSHNGQHYLAVTLTTTHEHSAHYTVYGPHGMNMIDVTLNLTDGSQSWVHKAFAGRHKDWGWDGGEGGYLGNAHSLDGLGDGAHLVDLQQQSIAGLFLNGLLHRLGVGAQQVISHHLPYTGDRCQNNPL